MWKLHILGKWVTSHEFSTQGGSVQMDIKGTNLSFSSEKAEQDTH